MPPKLSSRSKDLTGQKFGRLQVVDLAEPGRSGATRWLCRCECGVEKVIGASYLLNGRTVSCGCWRRYIAGAIRTTHNNSRRGQLTPEYKSWRSMRRRCLNPKSTQYRHYGGRGITICEEWRDNFEAFLVSVGLKPSPNHSLDRIDVNGNYEPSNVRWATQQEQMSNTRNSVRLTHAGRTMSASEWAAEIGIKAATILNRKRKGWTDEEALTKPLHLPKDQKRTIFFTKDGKTQSVHEWTSETGINTRTLLSRRRMGWSDDEALTKPVQQRKSQQK